MINDELELINDQCVAAKQQYSNHRIQIADVLQQD
jgi:hypothetical protein